MSVALMALTSLIGTSCAHSWVEQMFVVGSNGTFTGSPGFARGNVLRTAPGFSDPTMVNLLPPDGRTPANEILSTDAMCKSTQQTQTQTSGSPRLQAPAGSLVALRYQENGHVTLPENQPGKPENRGTVYVYGTTQPSPNDTFLAIHKVWNTAGTGGDKRGKLIATQAFDDGQCYQINGGNISEARQKEFPHQADQTMGANLWCQNDIALPSDAPANQPYTLYWVWDWPTAAGTPGFPEGKQEIYTSCMDIDIAGSTSGKDQVQNIQYIDGQSLNSAAVPLYVSDLAKGSSILATQSGLPLSTPASSGAAQTTAPPAPPAPPSPATTPSAAGAPAAPVTVITITITSTLGPAEPTATAVGRRSAKFRALLD
ncbi:hypothetical protein MMC20_005233 [Loxospora ochrophaea]|nr:hypothetical protein [Loxospora ochrophaea]